MTSIMLKSSGRQDPRYSLACWLFFNVTKNNIQTNGPGGDIGPLKQDLIPLDLLRVKCFQSIKAQRLFFL